MVIAIIVTLPPIKATASVVIPKPIIYLDSSFSEDNLIKYLHNTGVKYPEIIYAQSRLESANYTSQIFKENKNLFGMTCTKGRPTTSLKCINGYAYFNTWYDSVNDMLIYQSLYLKTKNKDDYYIYLKNNYGKDTLYISKIKVLEIDYYKKLKLQNI